MNEFRGTNQPYSLDWTTEEGERIITNTIIKREIGDTYVEYYSEDKSLWAAGEWRDEPDKVQWVDHLTNYNCLIVRNSGGALGGYVGVPSSHPCYEKEFHFYSPNELNLNELITVHGGIDFTEFGETDGTVERDIRFGPIGNDDLNGLWIIGFVCSHILDLVPKHDLDEIGKKYSDKRVYRNMDYVKSQVQSLAYQLKLIENLYLSPRHVDVFSSDEEKQDNLRFQLEKLTKEVVGIQKCVTTLTDNITQEKGREEEPLSNIKLCLCPECNGVGVQSAIRRNESGGTQIDVTRCKECNGKGHVDA